MIKPHGGKLIRQILSADKKYQIINNLEEFIKIKANDEQIKDIFNITRGVYSPLTGFLKEKDFHQVLNKMRLENNLIWSIPIILDISKEEKEKINKKKEVIITDKEEHPIAIMQNIEIYKINKTEYSQKIFETQEKTHPGVEYIFYLKEYFIGGDINLLYETKNYFPEHNFIPEETRKIFRGRGWKTIAGFQTRNVPHRGHEFLQKEALKEVDGLFIQPIVGEKKLENFKDEVILSSYEILIHKYYPKNRVVLGILPIKMNYAGPREAIFHALIRKNYGCTHFIIGRDHAGVGNYYAPFAAQEIFENFKKEEIDIEILKYPEVVYNKSKKIYNFINNCNKKDIINFSGTKLRKYIKSEQKAPSYLIREEVYNQLIKTKNILIDIFHQKNISEQKGFVLWFTGLSQSGKSTIADRVYVILKEKDFKVERLDGDIVRESLTKDLGFTKKDRDENIRRITFVSKLLSRNNIGVIASFISPYKQERKNLRIGTENFIEVFVNTPLEVCEKRDQKGIYAKARKGEIKNFTGISDPYEKPKKPEIELKPAQEGIEECTQKVINYLLNSKLLN